MKPTVSSTFLMMSIPFSVSLSIIVSIIGSASAASQTLTLNAFLEDVRTHNPEARSALQSITSFEARVRESEVTVTPEAYASFGLVDDRRLTLLPIFYGSETRNTNLRVGVRDQTTFGLGIDLFAYGQRTNIYGVNPGYLPLNDYFQSQVGLNLTESLWRNSLGEATRAQVEAKRAENSLALMENRFHLKKILLDAQNAYWSVVTSHQIVRLQEENVERARKLRDYMSDRAKLRLFDDTDAMQALASYETRALELQKSLDERASRMRQLNTLRGLDSDDIPNLEELPPQEMMADALKEPKGQMTREDFEQLRAQAKMGLAKATYAKSQIQPQMDISAGLSTNGLDGSTSQSLSLTESSKYPMWNVGINFSIPLDFTMLHDVKRGYRAAGVAAEELMQQASFAEGRVWNDFIKQRREAQGQYERALKLENIQTELVKRERLRLLNGRATTFESLSLEQNLALAQIQRAQAQLALLQISNAIKTFEAKQ